MNVRLNSINHDKVHKFTVVFRDHEILFLTPEGKEIATIKAETMEQKITDKTEATNNFWLCFEPSERCPLDKNVATAQIEPFG